MVDVAGEELVSPEFEENSAGYEEGNGEVGGDFERPWLD
jgi:hypothetical protein